MLIALVLAIMLTAIFVVGVQIHNLVEDNIAKDEELDLLYEERDALKNEIEEMKPLLYITMN